MDVDLSLYITTSHEPRTNTQQGLCVWEGGSRMSLLIIAQVWSLGVLLRLRLLLHRQQYK